MPATPRATYRLQLGPGFGFDDAAALVPYLAGLGVSHVYLSPFLQTPPGATHGYAVADPTRVSEELGGPEAHARLTDALDRHGLKQLLDIVPNHMAAGPHNPWWWDVMKHGPASRYAGHFDIDWDPPEPRNRGKLVLPVLGDHVGRVVEAGELRIDASGGEPMLRYHDHAFPLAPGSLFDDPQRVENDPSLMLALLDRQHYRLAFWKAADHELNYRRFFDIKDLAGVRVEDAAVFEDTHRVVLELIRGGAADGLRVDHPDGLRDPKRYFEELRAAAPEAWIIAEKILEPGEALRDDWPIDGTTGYDFLNAVQGLFIDPDAEAPLTDFYAEFTGETTDYPALLRASKLKVLEASFGSEVERLASLLVRVCERHPTHRGHTRPRLREAVRELAASFPVYRTYVRPEVGEVSDEDRGLIDEAVDDARERRPDLDPRLFDLLRDVLTLRLPGEAEGEVAARFQQLSAPAMAKGAEDTAFYNYHRLITLNEVGGDPSRFGCDVEEFHELCLATQQDWPRTMLTTSTHDTKRSEDVRARLAALTQAPERWIDAVRHWSRLNERFRRDVWPDRNAEYLLYQTIVGAWPISTDRLWAFMRKAAREAKRYTSWTSPEAAYEEALEAFVRGVSEHRPFCEDVAAFVAPLVEQGRVNALAQTLIRLTAPGVPDTYQGQELWDLSLVDPDNRRPVDFEARRRALERVRDATPEAAMEGVDAGLPKMMVVQQALRVRREHPEAFGPEGDYTPLATPREAVAFVRGGRVATVAPRFHIGADGPGDAGVTLPPGSWRDAFTGQVQPGGRRPIGELLARFPVALLVKEGA